MSDKGGGAALEGITTAKAIATQTGVPDCGHPDCHLSTEEHVHMWSPEMLSDLLAETGDE